MTRKIQVVVHLWKYSLTIVCVLLISNTIRWLLCVYLQFWSLNFFIFLLFSLSLNKQERFWNTTLKAYLVVYYKKFTMIKSLFQTGNVLRLKILSCSDNGIGQDVQVAWYLYYVTLCWMLVYNGAIRPPMESDG